MATLWQIVDSSLGKRETLPACVFPLPQLCSFIYFFSLVSFVLAVLAIPLMSHRKSAHTKKDGVFKILKIVLGNFLEILLYFFLTSKFTW